MTTTCPSCHGSGKRAADTGFHDVTKTKPSHHRASNVSAVAPKAQWPVTPLGVQLAEEVRAQAGATSEAKTKLIQEIMDHEDRHGLCTQTFIKKVRKQIRPRASS